MTRLPHRLAAILPALVGALTLLSGCDGGSGPLPRSGGRPYEVLLVGDRQGIVRAALSVPVQGLPQTEPEFDVSDVDTAHFTPPLRAARTIVTVSVDPGLYTGTRIRYEKNVWAKPQMMVYVCTPSVQTLRADFVKMAPTLRQLLRRAELNAAIVRLRQQRNPKAEKIVKRMFGIDMWIPMDMVASKQGKDFLWLSNSAPENMQNIVIYRCRRPRNEQQYVMLRDSVMGRNIKGETDAMQMKTVAKTVKTTAARENGRTLTIRRGLWEMEGDAMGGPFVSHSTDNLTVEAFVFAPGKKKRNSLRHTEAALYTLK